MVTLVVKSDITKYTTCLFLFLLTKLRLISVLPYFLYYII